MQYVNDQNDVKRDQHEANAFWKVLFVVKMVWSMLYVTKTVWIVLYVAEAMWRVLNEGEKLRVEGHVWAE